MEAAVILVLSVQRQPVDHAHRHWHILELTCDFNSSIDLRSLLYTFVIFATNCCTNVQTLTYASMQIWRVTFYSISWFYSCATNSAVLIIYLLNRKVGQQKVSRYWFLKQSYQNTTFIRLLMFVNISEFYSFPRTFSVTNIINTKSWNYFLVHPVYISIESTRQLILITIQMSVSINPVLHSSLRNKFPSRLGRSLSPWPPWWRGPAVEHWSLADVLSLSCARLAADGWPLMWVSHPL